MDWGKDDTFLARWLSGELTEEERKAFEESPDYVTYTRMIKTADQLRVPESSLDDSFAKIKSRIKETEQKTKVVSIKPYFKLAIAASIILAVSLTIYLLTQSPTDEFKNYQTAFSEVELIDMPDDSYAKLNASSSIAYNAGTWGDDRTVKLKGEAFFQVTKGKPFIVNSSQGTVQVLGTSFNVKDRGDVFEVLCYTGKVKVTQKNKTAILTPGKKVRFESGKMLEQDIDLMKESPSWTERISDFKNGAPLAEVFDELYHQYGVKVKGAEHAKDLNFTGAFPNDNVSVAVKMIFDPYDLKYKFDEENLSIEIEPNDQ